MRETEERDRESRPCFASQLAHLAKHLVQVQEESERGSHKGSETEGGKISLSPVYGGGCEQAVEPVTADG